MFFPEDHQSLGKNLPWMLVVLNNNIMLVLQNMESTWISFVNSSMIMYICCMFVSMAGKLKCFPGKSKDPWLISPFPKRPCLDNSPCLGYFIWIWYISTILWLLMLCQFLSHDVYSQIHNLCLDIHRCSSRVMLFLYFFNRFVVSDRSCCLSEMKY
jgi:hypothetical protein